MKSELLWDIKRLYEEEFLVGVNALNIIKDKLNIKLPKDEAVTIALYILNAELNRDISDTINMINLIDEILEIVKLKFNIKFNDDSINYYRFIKHLKFFSQRLTVGKYYNDEDNELFEMIKLKYPDAYECTEIIESLIKLKYGNYLTKEEKLYLTVHIERIIKENH